MIIRMLHCQDTTTQRIPQKKHQSFQPTLRLQDQPVLGKDCLSKGCWQSRCLSSTVYCEVRTFALDQVGLFLIALLQPFGPKATDEIFSEPYQPEGTTWLSMTATQPHLSGVKFKCFPSPDALCGPASKAQGAIENAGTADAKDQESLSEIANIVTFTDNSSTPSKQKTLKSNSKCTPTVKSQLAVVQGFLELQPTNREAHGRTRNSWVTPGPQLITTSFRKCAKSGTTKQPNHANPLLSIYNSRWMNIMLVPPPNTAPCNPVVPPPLCATIPSKNPTV